MTTTTQNLGSLAVGFLSITNIIDTETDTGTTTSFLGSGPFVLTDTDVFGLSGVSFQAFSAGVSGVGSMETNVFTYKVSSSSSTQLINSMDSSYQIDTLSGLLSANIFTAVEQAFDTAGNLIATQTISASSPSSTPLVFTQAYSSINVRVTWTMDVTALGSVLSAISTSSANQNFGTIASSQLCSIGDIVFLDTNHDGLEDAGFDGGPGVKGVTVELLDSTGTTILATTTTDANGRYSFNNLMAGTYKVEFLTPTGYAFTTQGVGTNAGINSSANQLTGISGPIILTAGQANHNVEAGLVATGSGGGGGTGGISVEKVPCKVVVSACGQITYNFSVTNTGSVALSNVKITDNIGTATAARLTTPTAVLSCGYNVGDANHNGALDTGETWQYTETINQISCNTGSSGSVCHTVSGTNLGSGCTAWLSTSFKPTNCHDGATYQFQGVKCTISGGGVGSAPIVEQCGDSIVTFSKNCTQATTHYDSARDCWVTTVPADSNPGSVFCTGAPVTVPAGCNLSGATCTWTVDDSSNNCGSTSVDWNGSCQGYKSLVTTGGDCGDDYNRIGVKVCDNQTAYGNGGCTTQGFGYNNGGYSASDDYAQNQCGWTGSGSDCAGTAENLQTVNNCGDSGGTQGGSCHFTAHDSDLCAGNTAWLSSTFTPPSHGDGDVYTFKGITCTISQYGKPTLTEKMPDAMVEFSNTCTQATTHYDAVNKIWVTVLPAGTNPGTVFMTGMPVTVPSGYNLNGASVTFSVGQTSNNCGASSLTFGASCQGYSSFNVDGHNGSTDYNQIGVKVCDNTGDYGCGGNIADNGYGWNGSDNTGGYWTSNGSWCGGWGSSYTCNGWNGSSYDSAGVAENLNTDNNCNSSSNYNCGGHSSYSGYNCYGYYGNSGSNYGCGDGYYGYSSCGTSSGSGYLCEGQTNEGSGCGTLGQITTGIAGAADTATVTATTAAGATVTGTDTAEVMILNNSTNVTVDGAATTASLTSVYGGARTLEFTYNASNVIALKQVQIGMANVTGSNTASQAFVVINNSSTPFASAATTYFQGTVKNGETIYADSTLNSLTNTPVAAANAHFNTTAGAAVYAYVFASQAAFLAGQAPLQSISYNASGSQAMHLGDQIGSLALTGYIGSNGGHLTSGGNSGSNDTLTLCMSEDAYQGDAQFKVTIDGLQCGDTMSTSALHASGDSNCFLLTGNWGSGAHQVGISFLNDAYGGTSSTDRNLYINSIGFDGTTYAGTTGSLCSNGTSTFTVGGSTATCATPADVLTVALSEDAYQGDAQFILFLDGKQVTTAQSVSALHGNGQTQSITYTGNFGAGSHTVGVQFTNDAYGGTSSTDRNLYVNSVVLNGSTVSGASANLYSNGTANFAITTLH